MRGMPADACLCANNLYSAVDWKQSACIIIILYFANPPQIHISFVILIQCFFFYKWRTALLYFVPRRDRVLSEIGCSAALTVDKTLCSTVKSRDYDKLHSFCFRPAFHTVMFGNVWTVALFLYFCCLS